MWTLIVTMADRATRPRIRFFASESTAHLQDLNSVVEDLIRNKIIRNEAQLFSDFFYAVLRHAKTQVEESWVSIWDDGGVHPHCPAHLPTKGPSDNLVSVAESY